MNHGAYGVYGLPDLGYLTPPEMICVSECQQVEIDELNTAVE